MSWIQTLTWTPWTEQSGRCEMQWQSSCVGVWLHAHVRLF